MIYTSIFNTFLSESFGISNFYINFAADFGEQKLHAQMAESVDALVSNTSGATRAGSTPALGTSSTKLSESKVLQVL